jgi:hypothetical protein
MLEGPDVIGLRASFIQLEEDMHHITLFTAMDEEGVIAVLSAGYRGIR